MQLDKNCKPASNTHYVMQRLPSRSLLKPFLILSHTFQETLGAAELYFVQNRAFWAAEVMIMSRILDNLRQQPAHHYGVSCSHSLASPCSVKKLIFPLLYSSLVIIFICFHHNYQNKGKEKSDLKFKWHKSAIYCDAHYNLKVVQD